MPVAKVSDAICIDLNWRGNHEVVPESRDDISKGFKTRTGVPELIELHAHAVHDREIHGTELAVIVTFGFVVKNATCRQCAAQAAGQNDRELSAVVLRTRPHAGGEE